jgi:hypothetical protein
MNLSEGITGLTGSFRIYIYIERESVSEEVTKLRKDVTKYINK